MAVTPGSYIDVAPSILPHEVMLTSPYAEKPTLLPHCCPFVPGNPRCVKNVEFADNDDDDNDGDDGDNDEFRVEYGGGGEGAISDEGGENPSESLLSFPSKTKSISYNVVLMSRNLPIAIPSS